MPGPSEDRPLAPRHFAGLFLLSAATLLLELSLTRLLSVALWYHFGFLVVSTALLGFGASGVALAAWPRLRESADLDGALAKLGAAVAGAIALAWIGTRQIPFDPFSLGQDRRQLVFGPLFEALWALPFFAAGLAIALLLGRARAQVNRLYGADLAGAALGCALLPLVMPAAGGPGSLAVAAALALGAGAVFAGARRARWALAAAALLLLGAAPLVERVLPVRITANKFPPQHPIWQGWNTLSFLQVESVPAPGGSVEPSKRRIVIDGGTALTGMWDLRMGLDAFLALRTAGARIDGSIAWPLKQAPHVLVIGSGGGEDLLDALGHGSPRVVGVEVNPLIVRLGRELMRDFWGGLFDHPAVEIVADEARSYVRRSTEKFDAIVSTHTISNAAVASGALGLSENFVLTREAFGDWLAHLAPGGIVYFTRPEAQLLRLTATVREAWDAADIRDPARCVIAWRKPDPPSPLVQLGSRGSFIAGVLAKNGPFTEEEVREVKRKLHIGEGHAGLSREPAEILYSPFEPGFDPRYGDVLTTADLPGFYASITDDVRPVTDDRPFFNQRVRWSRLTLADLRDVFGQGRAGRLALEDRPIAEVTLLLLLAQSGLLAALFLLLPLRRFARTGLPLRRSLPALTWFAALGLGFILIEMALLQRYTLYLGQPVFSLSVVLAALLLASGLGSAIAGRFAAPFHTLRVAVPALLLVLAATAAGGRALFAATLGWPFAARVALAALSLAPLGLLLGVPFSTSLRALQGDDARLLPWAWGVNGFATVLGTVLGLFAGMTLGFDATLAISAVVYLLGLAAFSRLAPES